MNEKVYFHIMTSSLHQSDLLQTTYVIFGRDLDK